MAGMLALFRERLPVHLKVFSVLLGVTLGVELLATSIIEWLHLKNNFSLYNFFILPEFLVYAWYYQRITSKKWIKNIIWVISFLFPVFWGYSVFLVFGINTFNSHIIVVSAFFSVFFGLSYYYELLHSDKFVGLSRHTEFWIATGMIIFYACQTPFYGMFNFLLANYLPLSRSLLIVLLFLNSTMYLIFMYAFLCRINTRK